MCILPAMIQLGAVDPLCSQWTACLEQGTTRGNSSIAHSALNLTAATPSSSILNSYCSVAILLYRTHTLPTSSDLLPPNPRLTDNTVPKCNVGRVYTVNSPRSTLT